MAGKINNPTTKKFRQHVQHVGGGDTITTGLGVRKVMPAVMLSRPNISETQLNPFAPLNRVIESMDWMAKKLKLEATSTVA